MSEIISFATTTSFGSAVFWIATIVWILYMLASIGRAKKPVVVETGPLDLGDPLTRTRLQAFLQKHEISGDAEIRDGFVYAPVPPERLEPLAHILGRADNLIAELQNPAADMLFLLSDGKAKITEIDLSDVREAASVMRRVAEDRKKSRTLYKGYTDDELKAVVRAGLSQWYKDHGDFEYSNKVMAGDYDDDRVVQQGLYILDLLFKVKGARND